MTDASNVALADAARMPLLYRHAWLTFRCFASAYFHWRILDADRVPATGPVILAANHASYIDPPMVGAAVNRAINYLARESLFSLPVAGWYLRQMKAVPVDRDGGGGAGLKAILDRLHAGGGIILFPEGTRSADGQLRPAKPGIGLTVIKSEAPVVPVRLFGVFEAWGRHQRWPRPRPVTIKFGRPLDFAALRAEARVCAKPRLKVIYQEVADGIMNAIGRLEPVSDVTSFPPR